MLISEEIAKEVAEMIILAHADDIEAMAIREMSYEELDMQDMSEDEQDKIWHSLYALVRSAKVIVEFPEG
jgi:hypothetical protein